MPQVTSRFRTKLDYSKLAEADRSIAGLTRLVVEASDIIPDDIEILLLKHIARGSAEPEKIQKIVSLYTNGAAEEAALVMSQMIPKNSINLDTSNLAEADKSFDGLTKLIIDASDVIPDHIELMLLKSVGIADPKKIQRIVSLYLSGAEGEATLAVDLLDDKEDGRLFGMKLEGADPPRRRARLKSDPD